MALNTVAILSPGDMGHAVGQTLREHELRVVTCLTGRSDRTRVLSEKAGIEDVPNHEEMVAQSDLIMSMTVSGAVPEICRQVADAVASTGHTNLLFAECNAIAPATANEMEAVITASGARFLDASIIGGPPRNGRSPRFYASGVHVEEFEQLREYGLDVRNIGSATGLASGIKMCYAAMTKGSAALHSQLLMAAEMMGLYGPLLEEFQRGHTATIQRMEGWIPGVPAKSRRWVSEMQEIGKTFGHLGMTPHLFQGVADMYRLIGGTPLGDETPESREGDRTLEETIRLLAEDVESTGS